MSLDEFLAWDPGAAYGRRWQLLDGEPVAMAPARLAHARLLRRRADGTWPPEPELIAAEGTLDRRRIGLALPLAARHRATFPAA